MRVPAAPEKSVRPQVSDLRRGLRSAASRAQSPTILFPQRTATKATRVVFPSTRFAPYFAISYTNPIRSYRRHVKIWRKQRRRTLAGYISSMKCD